MQTTTTKIQAAAIGAMDWPIVPIAEWNGLKLRYPVGVGDIEEIIGEEFNFQAFKSIPLYFYKGIVFTSIQYLIFTIIAVFGFLSWKKLYKSRVLTPQS